jgi:uroporphyrinogen-III synthase
MPDRSEARSAAGARPSPRYSKRMPFEGLEILSFESRRAAEMAELIRRQGGAPFLAPAMRESPLESNEEALHFAQGLFAGAFDMFIALTGVGVRALNRVLAPTFGETAFRDALARVTVVARGPKPAAALREIGVPVAVNVPEPNTWRELLIAIENRPERRIAVQEYGVSNTDLLDALRGRGAAVTPVRVYRADLPEDTGPLREAVRGFAEGNFDVVLFTTSSQVFHLFRIASELRLEEEVRGAFRRAVVASIGPSTTETLEEFGIVPDLSPSHPKMGFLVKEAAEQAHAILRKKRT